MLVQTREQPTGLATTGTGSQIQVCPKCEFGSGFSTGSEQPQTPGPQEREPGDAEQNFGNADKAGEPVKKWIPRSKYRKIQMKLRKQKITIIFNYSSITITPEMEKVLNRDLNFCVLPLKLDLTQILSDFKRFERTVVWKEYWYGTQPSDQQNRRIFKIKKHNFPTKHKTPSGLKTFIGAVKSEISDPRNRNQAKSNLPPDEVRALKELIRLQRERIISIKPCDKGAGLIIANFDDYLEACDEHLKSTNSDSKPFYTKVNATKVVEAKTEIKLLLQEALDNEIITKNEFEEMNPDDKNPGKFYCTAKVHKDHEEGKFPPPRPIVVQ